MPPRNSETVRYCSWRLLVKTRPKALARARNGCSARKVTMPTTMANAVITGEMNSETTR